MSKILALGESMARFSSFSGQRLTNSTQLNLTYGGAESNVAVNLSQLGHDTMFATKVPENSMAHNLVGFLQGYNVDCTHVLYGGDRIGTYFLEVGSGVRPSQVIYDRKYSSISMMKSIEWDLDRLFEDVELFHITGITLGLSKAWHQLGVELIKEAKKRGIKISFDMNFRQKLWTHEEAKAAFEQIFPLIDYLSAGRLDAIYFFDIPATTNAGWEYYAKAMVEKYSNIKYVFGTNRENVTPNSFIINGHIWETDTAQGFESKVYTLDQVVDRVGAGDSYASGILDGIINGKDIQDTVEFAMAASALKHTVQGDINLFSRGEIENFMSNSQNILR